MVKCFIMYAVLMLLAASLSVSGIAPRNLPSRFTAGHIPAAFIKVGSKPEVKNDEGARAQKFLAKATSLPGASLIKAWVSWAGIVVPMVAVVFSPMLNPLFQGIIPAHGSMMKLGIVVSLTLALIFSDSSQKSSKLFLSDAANSLGNSLESASERGSLALERVSERGSLALERVSERGSNTVIVVACIGFIGYVIQPFLFPNK